MEKLRPSAEAFKKKVGDMPVVMLEAGVYRGHYSLALYNNFNCKRLYLMDTWNKTYENGKYVVPEILDYAKKAMSFFDDCANVMMIKFSTLDFDLFPDNHFHYVYLDNDHSYPHCKIEFEKYWKLVKPGFQISGDNFEAPGVRLALDEFCAKYNLKYETKPWKVNQKTGDPIASDWWIWKEDLKTIFINDQEYNVDGSIMSCKQVFEILANGELIDTTFKHLFKAEYIGGATAYFENYTDKMEIKDGMRISIKERD